ncbi:hypothetical protein ASE17_19940 [Phenylobacterium sp. Root77]|jgi:multicomponent K+:H+ antiporter subunit D|uniref:monovalent cation/H+ antiporter subunit D n=1 Tax=unclassified Phenylobacterium TaxID=2640670 RepID=UPI0006FE9ADA|nr:MULTISPECIES: monovalent cation/H+ antiporter subunit D [unclassified Phenylobacterium]KQW66965.1 hypothetical protein ASC73_17665 [Phenylobacterium sp. Root1277]KQW89658.1 hypothetical protein ASC79_18570 [Phenylobacterium sp. Root1290]KRC43473.1 hypothetical protein ASE17_19940 [Phenylobacterium sp. Root77]
MTGADHLVIMPILIPLLAGAGLLLIGERRPAATIGLSVIACALHVGAVVLLSLHLTKVGGAAVYEVGNWPAPFGITLVADRLSTLFLGLAGFIGFAAFVYSTKRWKRQGAFFAPLFQFLLMGLSGVFLTGDLFNLFVFFEVTLTASYGLALHGAGKARVVAGLHYIVVNLIASLLFLLGATLFFGVAGSLNFADLAVRIPQASDRAQALLSVGAALLAIAFLIKAAAWPVGMWLPGLYGAAAAPVAAVFVLLTKVGIYAIIRLGLLWSPEGQPSPGLVVAVGSVGAATICAAMIGLVASRSAERMAGYLVVLSSGTLLAAFGAGGPLGGLLFYLVVSSLASCAFFLLAGLLTPQTAPKTPAHAVHLEPYPGQVTPRFAPPEATLIVIPRPAAFLGGAFLCCVLLLSGVPPLSGFIAKLALLQPMLAGPDINPMAVAVAILIIASGLATLVALSRVGIETFWSDPDRTFETIAWPEALALIAVLAAALFLTVRPEPGLAYARAAADQLTRPGAYVAEVLPNREAIP